LLPAEVASPLWEHLRSLSARIGTEPPDQIVAGIDDNFFVTENPVTVDGKIFHGRTLFISLSLLKQLNASEADAVLAHEMAHFSGQDTMYSKKISPLLTRYGIYLAALQNNPVALPVFQFMVCFRALFELSLRKLGRQRELRADRIAVETISPEAFTGAMLRIAAYSKYREQIQKTLFKQECVLESVEIGRLVEGGFPKYAATFSLNSDLDAEEIPHPFDTHPPIALRIDAVGSNTLANHSAMLASPGDGRRYYDINGVEQIEQQLWSNFEARFREVHEKSLPYRFLPETEEERTVVVAAFPEVSFTGKKSTLTIDYEKINHSSWPEPLQFSLITKFALNDNGALTILYEGGGKHGQIIKTKDFGKERQKVINAINQYYSRYRTAVEYIREKKREAMQASASSEQQQ
jgi:Zn-dependent protease with chaperone function